MPHKKRRVFITEVLGGATMGVFFALGGVLISTQMTPEGSMGWDEIAGALGGVMLGYPLGVATGVFFAGKRMKQTGSFVFALLGSILGTVLVFAFAVPLGLTDTSNALWLLFVFFPPLIATLGNHLHVHMHWDIDA